MTKTAREVIRDWGLDEEAYERTDALIASLGAVGFVIVPKEPTPEMIEAGAAVDQWCQSEGQAPQPQVYRAMIAAAETQP